MRGTVEIYREFTEDTKHLSERVYLDSNLIVDGAGESIADLFSFKRVPSGLQIQGSSLIHDVSNFGVKAFTLGTARDSYRYRDSLYALSSTYNLSAYAGSGEFSSYYYCKQPDPVNSDLSAMPISQPYYSYTGEKGLILKNEDFTEFIRLEENGDFTEVTIPVDVPNPEQCRTLNLYDYPGWTVIGHRRKENNPAFASGVGDVVKEDSGFTFVCSSTYTYPGNAAIYTTIRPDRNFHTRDVSWLGDTDKKKTIQVVFDMLSHESGQEGIYLRVINKRTGDRYTFTSTNTLNAGQWNVGGQDKLFTNSTNDKWETKSTNIQIPYEFIDDAFTFALYPVHDSGQTRTRYSVRSVRIGYLDGWDVIKVDGDNTKVQVSSTITSDASSGASGIYVSSVGQNYNHKMIQSCHGLHPDKAYALVFQPENIAGNSAFNVVLRKRTISHDKYNRFDHFTRVTYDPYTNPVPPYMFSDRYAYENVIDGHNSMFSPIGHPSSTEGVLPSDRCNKFDSNSTSPQSFTWINTLDSYIRPYTFEIDTYQVSSFNSNQCYKGYVQLEQKWEPPGIGQEVRTYNWITKQWDITDGKNKDNDLGEDHKFYVGTSSFDQTNKWKNNEATVYIGTKNGAVENVLNPYAGSSKYFNIDFNFYWDGGNTGNISPMYTRRAKLLGFAPDFVRLDEFPVRYYNWTTNRWSGTFIGAAHRKTIYASSGVQTATPIVPGYSSNEEIDVILEVATGAGEYFIHSARLCDLSLIPYHGTADISNQDIVTSENEYLLPVYDKPDGFYLSWYNHAGDLQTSSKGYRAVEIRKDNNGNPLLSVAYNPAGLRSRLHYQAKEIPFLGRGPISYAIDGAASGGIGNLLRTTLSCIVDGNTYQYDWNSFSWVKTDRSLFNREFSLYESDQGIRKYLSTSGSHASGIENIASDGEYIYSFYTIDQTSGLQLSNFRMYEVVDKALAGTSSIPEFPTPLDTTLQSTIQGNKAYELGHFGNFIEFSSMRPNLEQSLHEGAYLPGSGLDFAEGTLGTSGASGVLVGILNQYEVITPSGYILENTTTRSSQTLADASAGYIVSSVDASSTREVKYILRLPYNDWKQLDHYYGGIKTMGLWSMNYSKTALKRLDDPGPPFISVVGGDGGAYGTSLYTLASMSQDKYHPEFKLFAKKALFPVGITIDDTTEFVTIIWTIKF